MKREEKIEMIQEIIEEKRSIHRSVRRVITFDGRYETQLQRLYDYRTNQLF